MAGVTNETYKAPYAGRGDTGPYPITFSVILDDGGNASDIVVKLLDTAGAETDITSTSTVSGMNVYTAASYAATYTVVLIRYPALTQPYDFGGITRFPVRLIQAAYNRLCYVIQRLALQSDQSFRVPLSEAEPAREPSKLSRASKWRAFDGNGDPIAVAGAAGAFPVTDFMKTVLDDTTAAAAIATLGNGSIAGFLMALGRSALSIATDVDSTELHFGKPHHFKTNNTTSRQLFNAEPPASTSWSSAISATGVAGIPAGAIGIRAKVVGTAYCTAAGNWNMGICFSDNNSNAPDNFTSHPMFYEGGYAHAAADPFQMSVELDIPLNTSGQFYIFTKNNTNITIASSLLIISAVGFYVGD